MEKKLLDDKFIVDQLHEWAQDDYPLTIAQEIKAKELFYSLMNEKQNITKTPMVQEALLAEIARKLSYGATPDAVFREHGDNRHLNYFDVFLEQGVSQQIQDVLTKNKIPTDVLKGIKKSVPFDMVKDNIRIVQELSEPPPTPVVILFQIWQGNKLIYEWTPNGYYEPYVDREDFNFEKAMEDPIQYTRSGNIILKKVVTPEETKVYEEIKYKSGRTAIIARGKGGKFTKKI